MYGALLYLRAMSLWNVALSRVRRLRQPKYLLGALAGAAYLYLFFWRRFAAAPGEALSGPVAVAGVVVAGGAAVAAVFGLGRVALAWLAPVDRTGLRFSEAEIAFLFPAPVSRRGLLHYRLLSGQISVGLSALVLAFLVQRVSALHGHLLLRIIGAWIVFATMDLHLVATALTQAGLRERAAELRRWRIGVFLALGLYLAALAGAVVCFRPPGAADPRTGIEGAINTLHALLTTGALPWLLLPFRAVTGPLLASGGRAFLVALPAALGLMALHYAWVLRSGAEFTEGAIAAAARRAARTAGGPGSRAAPENAASRHVEPGRTSPPVRPRSEPFALAPQGRPEIAFLWKNLLSIQNMLIRPGSLRIAGVVTAGLLVGLSGFLRARARAGETDLAPIVVAAATCVVFYTLVLGPQLARQDLRSDLPNADLLKTYPLAGWQIALGELLAPTAILTAVLWLAILATAAALGATRAGGGLSPGLRAVAALCLGAIAPFACLIQLLVPNGLMILFPGWYQTSRSRGGGVEVMGQRLIFVFGQIIVAALALAPAALAAAVLVFASQWLIGPSAAVLLATAAVLAILGGEAVVGLWWLGTRFEQFDLSSELKP
jgi:hypothetical protein